MVTERQIENTLVSSVKSAGGACLKWASPSQRGVPDRICLLPGGRVVFAECKRPGGRLTQLQARMLERLAGLGFTAAVVDSPEAVQSLLEGCRV